MIDLIFLLLALAVAAVVIFAWRRVHHEHLEARAQQAAEEERRAKEVPAREPAKPAAVRPPVEWAVPQPAEPPRSMYWPAFLALGLVWLGWGAISSPIFIFAGFAIVVMALTLWIREMLHAN